MGSLLAARLTQAGQDVYLLARGNRLENLSQNSIRLQNMLTGQQENVKIKLTIMDSIQAKYDNCLLSMSNFRVKYIHVGEYIHGYNEIIN